MKSMLTLVTLKNATEMSKKIKKIFSLSCLILAFSATQALAEDDDYDVAGRVALIKSSSRAFAEVEGDDDPCMAISPLCIIRTILKATPTLPVHDIIATPAMIRHVPAALAKEGQLQLKLTAEEKLRKLRSKDTPSKTKVPFISPGYDGAIPAANEEYMTLEAFPVTDSEDPIEIAKAIEPIFVRLGWNDPDTPVTQYSVSQTTLYYAAIICAILPFMALYPFLQKYFVKGTMVGAVKG